MRYDIRHFRRPVCAFPGCGNEYDGDEAEWWSDPYWAFDQAWEDDWLVLDGRHDEPVCFCPEHLLHGGDGRPVCYDPEKRVPATPELRAFYDDLNAVDFMPLPKPGCEPQVLHALLHSGLVTADHPFLLPICEYPHCGAVFADGPTRPRRRCMTCDTGRCSRATTANATPSARSTSCTTGTAGRCRSGARYCRPRWRSAAPTRGCRP